ncbi:RloB domain-containing protein [Pseudomonas putida]|uniref:RloB domain-containing protein n=1 Tax=Pseudomonas putida TaxID=303 RepID=A0A2Z4RMV4_PSEPU|nr:RloB family protein [Pseudomonas putida]AWY42277.1 RloB domain-containing protein [Pseudomonas putida]
MGSEKSRSGKAAASFQRKKSTKEAGKRYLIVCEGSKTEPNYFRELRHDLRLKTATIEICGEECGSDPVSVYEYAVTVVEEEKGAKYDQVFCVIDKDDHKNLDEALEKIAKQGDGFTAILSYPCFEYWLLLHFVLHRNAFTKTGTKSIGAVALSELKKHDTTYDKGTKGTWIRYKDKLETALANSREIKKISDRSGNLNPSTSIHELVQLLVGMA